MPSRETKERLSSFESGGDGTPLSVADSGARYRRLFETARDGALIIDFESEPKLRIDADKMRRVFLSLIRNAFDAMPEGGMLTIASTRSDGNLKVAYMDTGEGMTKDTMRNLWSPLFATKPARMGLGLPIIKRFKQAHGGSVSVESEADRGSTFSITLPITSRSESIHRDS